MKRVYCSILLVLTIALTACGTASPASPSPTAAPAATTASTNHSVPGTVSATAEVVPAETSEMAFVISAPVKQVAVKEGDRVRGGQTLIVLNTPDLEYDIVAAQAELKSAQANEVIQHLNRKKWNGEKFIWHDGLTEYQDKAKARVLQAQATLEAAQASLAQGTLLAPFDGTVVSIDATPGEVVDANKTVLVIGDLSHLQIKTKDLSEREITNVRIGQTATARLKAFDQELKGKVIAIAPLAEESDGDTVFKVTIQLDQQPQGLLWGMTGDVDIQTQ